MSDIEKKYKICSVTTIHKTMDWFVTPAMRHLDKNNFDISLLCNMNQDFIDENIDYAKCYHMDMSRGVVRLSEMFKTIFKMYKLFKRERFDLVIYTTPNAAFYSSIAAFLARVPNRQYNQWGIRYVSFKGVKRFIFKLLEKITCIFSSQIKSVSLLNMDFAITDRLCSKSKISVIGVGGTIGIDLNEYRLENKVQYKNEILKKHKINKDAFVFGYVGRINKDKGLNELISAFIEISSDNNDVILMLVGMIDESNQVNPDLIKWAIESNQVILVGNVEPNAVCKYLSAIDLLVHPTYREGFGKVLQEAMGMKTPIITTDVPGPSEVIEENISGQLFKAGCKESVKNAMIEVMNNSELRDLFAENGRLRAVKFFDRQIMLDNILSDTLNTLHL